MNKNMISHQRFQWQGSLGIKHKQHRKTVQNYIYVMRKCILVSLSPFLVSMCDRVSRVNIRPLLQSSYKKDKHIWENMKKECGKIWISMIFMQLFVLHSPTSFPCLCHLSTVGFSLCPYYVLSSLIECLLIDPGSFTGYGHAIGYFLLF